MDPTIDPQMLMNPQNQQAMQGANQNSALQNALMLQAIKASAAGGISPQGPTMGQGPAPAGPVDPNSMPGGLGSLNPQGIPMPQQTAGMNAMGQPQPNPVVNALMSPIPGGGQ